MNKRSIVQEYYVLAVNENGTMPALNREASKAGLVTAGLMELSLEGIIALQKKTIMIEKELPDELRYLAPLYEYLQNKERSANQLMNYYLTSTGERLQRLIEGIGEALLKEQAAEKGSGGLFGKKAVYIPKKTYKEEIIGHIKSSVENESALSSYDMTLFSILSETKNLNRYFSDYERKALNRKLKELKKNPGSKQLAEMISSVSDMSTVMAAAISTGLM